MKYIIVKDDSKSQESDESKSNENDNNDSLSLEDDDEEDFSPEMKNYQERRVNPKREFNILLDESSEEEVINKGNIDMSFV